MFYDFYIEELDEKLLKDLGFSGACVFGKSKSAKLKLIQGSKYPKKADFIVLESGDEKKQRAAIRRVAIDAIHGFIKYPAIKEMSNANIAVLVSFNDLLNSKDLPKTLHLMKRTIKLAKKYKTPIIIVSGATNKWEYRAASDLIGFGQVIGLSTKAAKEALFKFQDKIFKRTKLKKAGKYIAPGVTKIG